MANKIQPSILEHNRKMVEKRANEIVDKATTAVLVLTAVYLSIHLIIYVI